MRRTGRSASRRPTRRGARCASGRAATASSTASACRSPTTPRRARASRFVLHGSNLTRGWGFANHRQAEFRPDDVVVCPDGTTSNGRGGFNFLQGRSDLDRFGGLHDELRKAFKVNGTYLYGHSQGSFFAHLYAAHRPGEVDGYVAHASAVWAGTALGRKGHHQAIVVMHGTADPVVWYEAGLGARASLEDAKYPTARLRSLEGWNHWPSEHNGSIGNVFVRHTSQQLGVGRGDDVGRLGTASPSASSSCPR